MRRFKQPNLIHQNVQVSIVLDCGILNGSELSLFIFSIPDEVARRAKIYSDLEADTSFGSQTNHIDDCSQRERVYLQTDVSAGYDESDDMNPGELNHEQAETGKTLEQSASTGAITKTTSSKMQRLTTTLTEKKSSGKVLGIYLFMIYMNHFLNIK